MFTGRRPTRTEIFLLLLLILVAFFRLANADCSHQIAFSEQSFPWTFSEDTELCDAELSGSNFVAQQHEMSPCDDDLFDVDLTPHSVFPVNKNVLPFVQLNITVTTSIPLDDLFLQFHCIYAPSKYDYLCHNHRIQLEKWGRMIWPCRRLQLQRQKDEPSRLQFSYTCFRLFSLSQYSLELFALHNEGLCRRQLIITIPMERQLDPKIAHFYTGTKWNEAIFQHHQPLNWSPLLALDISFNDVSLLIQMHPMDWLLQMKGFAIGLSVFTITASTSASSHEQLSSQNNSETQILRPQQYLLFEQRILPTRKNNSLSNQKFRCTWPEVGSGNYTIYVYLSTDNCHLACNELAECRQCPHTALNFTLAMPKHTSAWRQSILLISIGKRLAFVVLGILTLGLVVLTAIFLYVRVWRPRAFARLPPRSVELREHPTVLVLYTDDCQAHSDTVLALCQTLDESANAKCHVDLLEFVANPTLRPSVWLADKLTECDFVLVIFSECSARVLAGEQLVQRRHFPDLFNAAIGFIVARIREIASNEGVTLPPPKQQQNGHLPSMPDGDAKARMQSDAVSLSNRNVDHKHCSSKSLLNRFMFAHFAYSPQSVIPPFFASTQFGIGRGGPLELPDQIGLLIARLHGVIDARASSNINGRNQHFLHQADLAPLNAAIEAYWRFTKATPNWMDERFIKKESTSQAGVEASASPSKLSAARASSQPNRIPTVMQQKELAERYGLLSGEVDEEDEEKDKNLAPEAAVPLSSGYKLIMDVDESDSASSSSDSATDAQKN